MMEPSQGCLAGEPDLRRHKRQEWCTSMSAEQEANLWFARKTERSGTPDGGHGISPMYEDSK